MKKTVKFLCIALVLICCISFFSNCIPAVKAADSDYEAYRLKVNNLLYPSHYYSTVEMTDTPTEHTFVKVASLYPGAAVDNSNKSALCSKPYKFNELYDNYVKNGSTGRVVIPCCVIDLALGGDPVEIAGFGMTLRSHFDCLPIHLKIQVATDAAATNWVTAYDAQNITWQSISNRWYFDPIDAYQVRVIALDIDEVNLSEEGDYYDPILGDETRFTYAEVDVFTLKEGSDTGDTPSATTKPTSPNIVTPTRPNIVTPTRPVTTTATQAPTKAPTQPATQAPTKAPTQPATQAPTAGGQTVTQPATKAPTQPATQAPTAATAAPTSPSDTVAPTEPTGTVDPIAPTDEPTVAPTDEPTAAPTVEATEPQATTPTDDNGGAEEPKDFPWIIVVIIAAAAVAAGGAVFFIIKKKKQG